MMKQVSQNYLKQGCPMAMSGRGPIPVAPEGPRKRPKRLVSYLSRSPGIAPFLQHFLQGQRSSAKVVSLLDGNILLSGTNTIPSVSKIGVTNPISEAAYV